jgi:hypothetical protein
MEDFDKRCAYSMQHFSRAGGESCMEVEHFNPAKKRQFWHKYEDLNLASRHCNLHKSQRWSNDRDVRFLNPSYEQDYGSHILEDPETHKLVGITPAGIYHVLKCGLNAEHLVRERAERSHILGILNDEPTLNMRGSWQEVYQAVIALREQVNAMIPAIPFDRRSNACQRRFENRVNQPV